MSLRRPACRAGEQPLAHARGSDGVLSYASFAIPFFVRSLGGVFFSYVGDRVGRRGPWSPPSA